MGSMHTGSAPAPDAAAGASEVAYSTNTADQVLARLLGSEGYLQATAVESSEGSSSGANPHN
jgi:hypothetical protein